MCPNSRIYSGMMIIFVCLHFTLSHYHHYADVSETELPNWASQILVRYILSRVCLRLSQFSQLPFMQYTCIGLCEFSLSISLLMIVRICVIYLSIISKSEVWPDCHCLGLGHETMVCTVCLSISLWDTPSVNKIRDQPLHNVPQMSVRVVTYLFLTVGSTSTFSNVWSCFLITVKSLI